MEDSVMRRNQQLYMSTQHHRGTRLDAWNMWLFLEVTGVKQRIHLVNLVSQAMRLAQKPGLTARVEDPMSPQCQL